MIILGHRGARTRAPENTSAAFDAAVALGADGFETDVRLTKDGVLVLLHDATLGRTTDGHGPIRWTTWEQARRLDAGSWFGADFSGQRIPRVEDVLDRYAGAVQICLEVKTRAATDPLIGLLRERGRADSPGITLISFSGAITARLFEVLPKATVGRLTRRLDERMIYAAYEQGLNGIYPAARHVDAASVQAAHHCGLRVVPWDVKGAPDLGRLTQIGIDGAIVDDPSWCARAAV